VDRTNISFNVEVNGGPFLTERRRPTSVLSSVRAEVKTSLLNEFTVILPNGIAKWYMTKEDA